MNEILSYLTLPSVTAFYHPVLIPSVYGHFYLALPIIETFFKGHLKPVNRNL